MSQLANSSFASQFYAPLTHPQHDLLLPIQHGIFLFSQTTSKCFTLFSLPKKLNKVSSLCYCKLLSTTVLPAQFTFFVEDASQTSLITRVEISSMCVPIQAIAKF